MHLSYGLADFILGAKNGVTSDLVVPVINLEIDTITSCKLSFFGVLSEKDLSLVTFEDPSHANKE